jgi:outer membrane protein assembly factor BamA
MVLKSLATQNKSLHIVNGFWHSDKENSGNILIFVRKKMQHPRIITILLCLLLLPCPLLHGQGQTTDEPDHSIRIDSISIKRNWRTRDRIIMEELNFKAGDRVSYQSIQTSMDKVWNTGNFATVRYRIDTLEDGRHMLELTARDVFPFYPILAIQGNRQDYRIGLGIVDENFLGRNIRLSMSAGLRSTGNDWNFRIDIPRQLLYRNMTLDFGTRIGNRKFSRIEDREPVYMTAFDLIEVSGKIGNPWHQDYSYSFSPDLGMKYFRHSSDRSQLDSTELALPHPEDYTYQGLSIGLSESIGTVNQKRHRKDGYRASIGTGFGIGLDAQSPYFQTFGLSLEYHKTLDRIFQLSSSFSTSYTTSDIPSLQYYRGASDIRGFRTGEIYGKSYYSAYLGLHMTYFSFDWLALEHAIYVNWGNGADKYFDLFRTRQLASVGTSFRFMIPMVPFIYAQFSFTYSGPGSNWFDFKF